MNSEHCPVCDAGSNTAHFAPGEVCSDVCKLRGNQEVSNAIENVVWDLSRSFTKEEFLEAMEGMADDLGLKGKQ